MTVRILSITRKEFIHIFRDPRTLAIMFLIPVVQLLMLGYAATTDVRHLSTAVLDQDRTPRSRALVDACRASGYFDIALYVKSEEEMARAIDSGAARAGLIIPVGYERTLARGEKAKVGFVIDGSDPNVSNTAVSAAQGVGQAHSVHILQEALVGRLDSAPGVDVHPRVWYNLGLSGIFLLTSLGFGILISTVSKTQQEAMLLTFFIMLPSIFLSGYFFPVDAMPPVLQAFSQVIPVTYVLIIVRSIMPKGVGLEVLMGEVSALVAFGGVVLTLSTARFRKRLD